MQALSHRNHLMSHRNDLMSHRNDLDQAPDPRKCHCLGKKVLF